MTKLNQIVALVNGKKTEYQKTITKMYHGLKQELVDGLVRVYTPFDDEDRNRPPEDSKGIALKLSDVLTEFGEKFSYIVNLVAANDLGNVKAEDAVEVDGVAVLTNVPVTHLLYLEKALTDLHTFVSSLPTLNPTRDWVWDEANGRYKTAPVETIRTTKRKTRFVKAEATDKHPAQVEVFDEDVPVGTWATTYISTALPPTKKKLYLSRVEALRDAVKEARERANSIDVDTSKADYGKKIIDFVFSE